jgi:hypothetical protein
VGLLVEVEVAFGSGLVDMMLIRELVMKYEELRGCITLGYFDLVTLRLCHHADAIF